MGGKPELEGDTEMHQYTQGQYHYTFEMRTVRISGTEHEILICSWTNDTESDAEWTTEYCVPTSDEEAAQILADGNAWENVSSLPDKA